MLKVFCNLMTIRLTTFLFFQILCCWLIYANKFSIIKIYRPFKLFRLNRGAILANGRVPWLLTDSSRHRTWPKKLFDSNRYQLRAGELTCMGGHYRKKKTKYEKKLHQKLIFSIKNFKKRFFIRKMLVHQI